MSPLTKAVNKQLLPIYDKPLIFYSLSVLMLAKIKDILIIVNKGQLQQYKKLLPNGDNLGLKITYKEQAYPKGLPDAFILGEKFIDNNNVALMPGVLCTRTGVSPFNRKKRTPSNRPAVYGLI